MKNKGGHIVNVGKFSPCYRHEEPAFWGLAGIWVVNRWAWWVALAAGVAIGRMI